MSRTANARLVVVGTGIQLGGQMTPLAASHVKAADKVLFLVNDVLAHAWLKREGAGAESLDRFYAAGKQRAQTYEDIVEHVLGFIRRGLYVCLAVYGHPGIFAYPTHEAVRRARAEGFSATMLPGVSAADCLYADLGIDPADSGCQSYEATDFLVHDRIIDTTSGLILWQIGVVGNVGYAGETNDEALGILIEALIERYGPDHPVALYLAQPHPIVPSSVRRLPLRDVPAADVFPMTTMYVPPLGRPRINERMLERLGLRYVA